MEACMRFLLPFLAAVLGGAAGTFAVLRLDRVTASGAAEATLDARSPDDLRREVADLRKALERSGAVAPAGAPPLLGRPEAPTGASAAGGASSDVLPFSKTDLEAAIEKATAAAFERRDERDKEQAEKAKKSAAKRRVALAEAARELNLSSSQEDAVRRAYDEATERFLKAMTDPDGDPAALRRELEDARGDKAKKAALTGKYMGKFLTKIGDFMTIGAERDAKIAKAVGNENVGKMQRYQIEEEDPFGWNGTDVSVGVTTSGN